MTEGQNRHKVATWMPPLSLSPSSPSSSSHTLRFNVLLRLSQRRKYVFLKFQFKLFLFIYFPFLKCSLSFYCSFIFSSIALSQAEVVAKRCGHSKPANKRLFMMPCTAMMILLCPPPPTLHQPPQLHRNVVQQVTRAPLSSLPPSLPPPPPHQCCHHRNRSPSFPNKKMKKGRNYRRGKLCRQSTKRGFMVGHIHSQKKGDGDPFKCGAAALIHWVKMGEEGVTEVR